MNAQTKRKTHVVRSPYLIATDTVNALKDRFGISDFDLAKMMDCSQAAISRTIRNENRSKKRQVQLVKTLIRLCHHQFKESDLLRSRFDQEGAAQ